jgi:hypothetical protein
MRKGLKLIAKALSVGAGLAAGAYAVYVARTWSSYGNPPPPSPQDRDPILDGFMPVYDVVERHHVDVNAPAAVTLETAKEMALSRLPIVRAIFKGREMILGSTRDRRSEPRGIIEETKALGWVVLDEVPGREIVMGAVTKPWEADVVFRSVSPEAFAAFSEPGYVKIVWTLRADPVSDMSSTFRTETRAVATDLEAERRFRWYWSFLSPGIIGIRWLSLAPIRCDAEGRARDQPKRELVHPR